MNITFSPKERSIQFSEFDVSVVTRVSMIILAFTCGDAEMWSNLSSVARGDKMSGKYRTIADAEVTEIRYNPTANDEQVTEDFRRIYTMLYTASLNEFMDVKVYWKAP